MTTKTMNHGELAEGIEHLVRDCISTSRIAAQGAVERAGTGLVGVRRRLHEHRSTRNVGCEDVVRQLRSRAACNCDGGDRHVSQAAFVCGKLDLVAPTLYSLLVFTALRHFVDGSIVGGLITRTVAGLVTAALIGATYYRAKDWPLWGTSGWARKVWLVTRTVLAVACLVLFIVRW